MASSTVWQAVSAILIVLVVHKIWTLQKALKCVSYVYIIFSTCDFLAGPFIRNTSRVVSR
ncbi:hypothetical protein PILCRDRAFT_810963 [Piloderma croceum F 1598]|uniref:Uncharacterized protein n=1 Tax=Piloderma croceum (strain F 1598) TaxID=765440 RepID=A0A0C3BYR0_PILCF|nr:hypothetical protein PILCRDRAFT_810963 [Piloderma croceum F 1598]